MRKMRLAFAAAMMLQMLFAFDIPAPAKWKTVGEGTRLETAEGTWKLLPGSGKENGIWSSHAFPLQKSKYRIGFRYRLKEGALHFIVKHGDNTYSLLDRHLPATGIEWREFNAEMEETRPGAHGSVWFLTGRPAEITGLYFQRIPAEAEQETLRRLAPHPVPMREPEMPGELPDLRETFLIAQEWHSWFYADTPQEGADSFFRVWGYHDGRSEYYKSSGPLWRRTAADLVYPYLGFYSAGNPEVIRWQLRCMKSSALDGVVMQLYPDPKTGRKFQNIEHFETCLRMAEQEGFRIGIHDEIQFMPQSAKEKAAFIERASSALKLAKQYPRAFLRRNGKILYQYEAWNLPYSAAEHQEIMEAVEKETGEQIYWMVCGPLEKMVQVEALSCLKYPANTWVHARQETTGTFGSGGNRWNSAKAPPDEAEYWQKWEEALRQSAARIAEANRTRRNKLEQAVWIYPGFNNAGRWAKTPEVLPEQSFDRSSYFLRAIRTAQKEAGPAVINLSSWNDREEKTMLEPSWSNESADPFEMVRLLAGMKRMEFTAPPLPPKEYVDPWMWSILYGIDRTPPRISAIRLHISEANLAVDAVDDLSGVSRVEISAAPTAYVRLEGEEVLACNCSFSGGDLKKDQYTPYIITLPARPEGYGALSLGIKYRAPENTRLSAVLRYPRETEHGIFRSTGERASTIPPGPVLHGRGNGRWYTVSLHNLKIAPDTPGKVEIHLKYLQGNATEEAAVEQLALFPAEIANESSRGFALPSPAKQVRSFVIGFPDKLLPRNFTGIPFALQAVDDEGNRSILQIFDLSEDDTKSSLGGRSIECEGYFWR